MNRENMIWTILFVLGGAFTWANGAPAGHVARWDGDSYELLGAGVGQGQRGAAGACGELRGLRARLEELGDAEIE